MMLANILASPILVALMWDVVPHNNLLLWLSIVYIASTLVFILYLYLRPSFKNVDTIPAQPIYILLPLLFGVIWGAAGFFFFTTGTVTHTAYLIIFLFGMASGAVNVLSPLWTSYISLAVPVLLPFIVRLFLQGYTHNLLIGATLLSFLIVMLIISKMTETSIVDSLKMRYENRNLLISLKEQSSKAEKANTEKSRFLAAASHDLRQPVHSLTLLANAIEPEIKTKRGKEILTQINNANETMLNLLHSLLDISKLDAGIIKPERSNISLSHFVNSLVDEFQPHAQESQLELRSYCSESLFTYSDPVLLKTITRNLLQNAFRYTKSGKILLNCRKRNSKILLQVWDTGRGIEDHQQEIIFAEYQQLNNPERDQNKGLGLGLSICRRLSKLLDIKLTLNSQIKKGSVFTLELPSVIQTNKKTTSDNSYQKATFYKPLDGSTILVIDDNKSVLDAMSSLLESWNCIVLTANSVEEVIRMTKNNKKRINAIIADYRLTNNTTGVEAIDAFNERVSYSTPSILITGDTAPERMREATSHGLPVLHKPIKEPHLKAVISRLLRNL